jgi:hypothetical protein
MLPPWDRLLGQFTTGALLVQAASIKAVRNQAAFRCQQAGVVLWVTVHQPIAVGLLNRLT